VLIAAATHVVSYLLLNSAVNAVGHTFGHGVYPGYATNSQWLAWLTGGEGLHSNHHAAPTSARLAFRRPEIDPGWWFIAVGARLRWLTVRHQEPRIVDRTRRGERTPEPV
jgi:stearoyl-CoA desaturase (delta-9 desaturase)